MQLFCLHRYHPVRDLRFAETVFSKLPECSLEKVCPPVNRRHAHMTIGMEKKTDPVETTEGIVVPMGPVGDAGSNGGGDRMDMCRSGGMALRDPKDTLHNIGGGRGMDERDIFGGRKKVYCKWTYYVSGGLELPSG